MRTARKSLTSYAGKLHLENAPISADQKAYLGANLKRTEGLQRSDPGRDKLVDARIINTTSVSGIYGNAGQTNYGAAKAGIAAFTIIASRELRRYGITVNAIAPAALTRMTEDLGMGGDTEEGKAQLSPRWIAPIVTWLASKDSAHVSGKVFESSGQVFAIAEGWHRGPEAKPPTDPTTLGPVVDDLLKRARKNAGMDGRDLD